METKTATEEETVEANVTYSVVIEKWSGDTTWGAVQETGNNPDNGKQKYISGDSKGLKGAKLKFRIPAYNRPDDGKYSFAGFGELY